jgi:nucleoside-diphosphate-sugar epimerase
LFRNNCDDINTYRDGPALNAQSLDGLDPRKELPVTSRSQHPQNKFAFHCKPEPQGRTRPVRSALVVGGTGPTGPPLVDGLIERGYDVTLFHTGRHELSDGPGVRHIHGNPFDADSITESLGTGTYDVVVASYGRVRLLADHFAGRCDHFLVVGGTPVYAGYVNPNDCFPTGMQLPVRESTHPRVSVDAARYAGYNVAPIRITEDFVFGLAAERAFGATYLRYPTIYGPRNPHGWEWTVVRRVLDGRPWMILSDDGRGIHSRAGARNAAEAILLSVDRPEVSKGKAYNVADDDLVSIRQWAELVAHAAGGGLEFRSLPGELPSPGWAVIAFGYQGTPSCVLDTTQMRDDLGYRDIVPLREGLVETVEWMLANVDEMLRNPNITDPFNYEAEDRLMAAYDSAMTELTPFTKPFAEGIRQMPVPQTTSGARAD